VGTLPWSVVLAAQHGLHLLGRRNQLVGLALRDALADMGLDEADEIGQLATGGGRLPGIDGGEHILQLVVQSGLQALGEAHAVDQADQIVDLGRRALDRHGEALAHTAGRIVTIADRTGDGGGANGEGRAGGRRAGRGGKWTVFVHHRWRGVGDHGALRAGGIDRDIGRHIDQRQIGVVDRHGEARTDRTIRIITIAHGASDLRRADGEGAAGGRDAAHTGQRAVLVHHGGRCVGHDRPLRAGGIDRDIGRHVGEPQVAIRRRVDELVGPDVAGGLPVIGAGHPALVGRWTARGRDVVDGRAAGLQGDGLGRATVILQAVGVELGVGVLQAARARKATTAIARQVVALIGQRAPPAVAPRIIGHDAPADRQRVDVVGEAATSGGRVVGEGAVADAHCAIVLKAAAKATSGGHVVGEGAVADAHRAAVVVEAAANAEGVSRVVGEGAVADAHRAPCLVEEAAAVFLVMGAAMGNGEGVEGESDAAVHEEHPHAVAPIEGDRLPAAVQGQILADGERAAEGDGATTTEHDRVTSGGAADDGADPPRARLPTTIGDGQGRSGSRMRVQAHSGQRAAQADQQRQAEAQADTDAEQNTQKR
jgi:hypothetical protein